MSTSERPPHLVPGYRLDRYELLCPIAEGGMASVWIARLQGKHGFEKLVAIKTILAAHANEPQFQHMFLDEARIASRIEHSNVAQILDLGDEHGFLYLVMEWINGDSLSRLRRAVLRKGQVLPLGIVLRILADASGGLHAAHELQDINGVSLGVVHRDVSPQNILVNDRGVAKVIDFGIAVARNRLASDTNAGVFKGKLQYMAPEQALGRRLDRGADIWAMGAVLYYLASGRAPVSGENDLALLHRLTSGIPIVPLMPSVPKPVRDVVHKALAFRREDRYATAAELQSALERAMSASGLTTTVADVSAFCEEHLADRSEARKQALALALNAAADRGRMQEIMKQGDANGFAAKAEANLAGRPERVVSLRPASVSSSFRTAPTKPPRGGEQTAKEGGAVSFASHGLPAPSGMQEAVISMGKSELESTPIRQLVDQARTSRVPTRVIVAGGAFLGAIVVVGLVYRAGLGGQPAAIASARPASEKGSAVAAAASEVTEAADARRKAASTVPREAPSPVASVGAPSPSAPANVIDATSPGATVPPAASGPTTQTVSVPSKAPSAKSRRIDYGF